MLVRLANAKRHILAHMQATPDVEERQLASEVSFWHIQRMDKGSCPDSIRACN